MRPGDDDQAKGVVWDLNVRDVESAFFIVFSFTSIASGDSMMSIPAVPLRLSQAWSVVETSESLH